MAQQQSEPRIESFGFESTIQEHVPEEERDARPQQQQRGGNSGKRQVAVSRRGPSNQRGASSRLDDGESDDVGAGDGDGDLDASADLDTDDLGDDEGADDLEALDEAAGDDGDDAGEAGDPDTDQRQARTPVSKEDKRTRKQLQAALSKQDEKLAELQRRLDGQDSRIQQSQDTQRDRQQAARSGEDEDELESMLEEVFSAGQDKEGFVKAGDLEKSAKQRKKLTKLIESRVGESTGEYVRAEVHALMNIPGAREAYREADRSGALEQIKQKHQYAAPIMFAVLREQHEAQVTKLTARHEKIVKQLKDQNRRMRLGDIPAGQGTRGDSGTGGRNNQRARGGIAAQAMDQLARKYKVSGG